MANGSTYYMKADTSDFTKQLKSANKEFQSLFVDMQTSAQDVTKAEKELEDFRASSAKKQQGRIKRQVELNTTKKNGAKLTKEQTAELKKLDAEIKNHNKLTTSTIKVKQAEVNVLKKKNTAVNRELTTMNKVRKGLKAETIAIKQNTKAVQAGSKSRLKENAERRALGTSIVRHIRRLESMAVAYYAVTRAYESTFGKGVELNKQYESMSLGLSALLASKTDYVDSFGNEGSALDKFNQAQLDTEATLDRIKTASLETPATFEQMVGFYQQAIGHALSANKSFGDSLEDISNNTIKMTQRMSTLGASVGMSMGLIDEEIRSLMSGNVSQDSTLAKILFGTPTDANKAVKDAKTRVGGMTELLDKALSPFDEAGKVLTYNKAMAKLNATIDTTLKAGSAPLFEGLKETAISFTKTLRENSDDIVESMSDIYAISRTTFGIFMDMGKDSVDTLTLSMDSLNTATGISVTEMKLLQTSVVGTMSIVNDLVNNAVLLVSNAGLEFLAWGNYIDYIEAKLLLFNANMTFAPFGDAKKEKADNIAKYSKEIEVATAKGANFEKQIAENRKGMLGLGDIFDKSANKVDKLNKATDAYSVTFDKFNKSFKDGITTDEITKIYELLDSSWQAQRVNFKDHKDLLLIIDKEYFKSLEALNKQAVSSTSGGKLEQKEAKPEEDTEAEVKARLRLAEATQKLVTTHNELNGVKLSSVDTNKQTLQTMDDNRQALIDNNLLTLGSIEDVKSQIAINEQRLTLNDDITDSQIKLNEIMGETTGTPVEQLALDIADVTLKMQDLNATTEQIAQVTEKMTENFNTDVALDFTNEMIDSQTEMLDLQIQLASTGQDWGASLKGVAKDAQNVAKIVTANYVKDLKSQKAKLKIEKKYEKERAVLVKDGMDTQALDAKFKDDMAKTDKANNEAQLAGYASLAGAMTSAFEQGSKEAIAFSVLQATLGIASSWTAIAQAWALGLPQSIPAVAMVSSAVLPIIGQLTAMGGGGGGGGGGSVSIPSVAEAQQAELDFQYEPQIDRLDRQIELLEAIGDNTAGTVQRLEITKAGLESELAIGSVENDIRKAIEDSADKTDKLLGAINLYAPELGSLGDTELFDFLGGTLEEANAILGLDNFIAQIYGLDLDKFQFQELQTLADDAISEFAVSTIDAVSAIVDKSQDLKDIYDELSGTNRFALEDLKKANEEINALVGDNGLSNYILGVIDEIGKLDADVSARLGSGGLLDLLMGDNRQAQVDAIEELGRITGETFDNGVEDALNYLESIELVSEAMVNSANNIKSFEDSFKSEDELLLDMGNALGITVAQTEAQLMSLFETLKGGLGGLTDAELEFLDANKSVLDSVGGASDLESDRQSLIDKHRKEALKAEIDGLKAQQKAQKDYLKSIQNQIKELESIINSVKGTIDTLRGVNVGSQGVGTFSDAIKEAMGISQSGSTDGLADALKRAISASGSLSDAANFQTQADMRFAQLVGAGQLEGIATDADTQLDVLKQIEVNTADSVALLSAQISALGISLSARTQSDVLADLRDVTSRLDNVITRGGTDYGLDTATARTPYALELEALAREFQALGGDTSLSSGSIYNFTTIEDMLSRYSALLINQNLTPAEIETLSNQGFATGGHTGNISSSQVAGAVHGREYVLNSQTTASMGLNDSSSTGVFGELVGQMKQMNTRLATMERIQYDTRDYTEKIAYEQIA